MLAGIVVPLLALPSIIILAMPSSILSWIRDSLLSFGVFVKIAYAMGLTTVTLEIKNPYDPNKKVEEDFLVDSGAAYTVLPKRLVKKLQLKPNYSQKFVLADGTKIQRKISSAFVKFEGREIASPVVLGEEKDSPLLGVLTLEALGLVLDPFERKLHPAHLML